MSKGDCRRRIRTSTKQFELILDFMEVHPNLAKSHLDSTYTVKDRKRDWAKFAHFLNSHRLGIQKDTDKWRKTWFDWKCNVRAKARSAAGRKVLSPLEERLIAVTGLLDCEENSPSTPRKERMPDGDVVYEIKAASPELAAASVASRSRSTSSAEAVPESFESAYGGSQDEYIVPTPDVSASSGRRLPVPVSIATGNGGPAFVLTDVRSLANEVGVKKELVSADEDEGSSEEDAASDSGARDPSGDRFHRSWEELPGHSHHSSSHRRCSHKKRVSPADCAESTFHGTPTKELKSKYEVQLFVANKRKLEAEERRADAEADFYREEKKRSVALANLHREEQRKMAAIADFHAEERRKAAAKVELLVQHKKFFIEQQKTEVLRRRMLQLEIRKLKREVEENGVR